MKLLNSANFGVPPEKRKSHICKCKKRYKKEFHYPIETHSKNGENGKLKWITVKHTLMI